MKRFFACLLAVMIVLSLFTVAMAETVYYDYTCYTNELTIGARAEKADSERTYYVRQTSTSIDYNVYYTSRNSVGTIVSNYVYFLAGSTGRKSNSYYTSHTVNVGGAYKLGIYPQEDGGADGQEIQITGRWTP